MSRTDPETTLEETVASPPINAERLLQLITDEYESLPRQLKRIASYMSQQSDRITGILRRKGRRCGASGLD